MTHEFASIEGPHISALNIDWYTIVAAVCYAIHPSNVTHGQRAEAKRPTMAAIDRYLMARNPHACAPCAPACTASP